ncbi:MAG: hydrolase [Acidobacteria bacterium]|nr:MAG: hydrolase [Acidobacteriota bacterium]
MRLILFDIDGTLIKCGIQVKGIFSSALVEVFGQTGDLDGYSFSGKIDTQIVFDLQEGAGLTRPQVAEKLPLFKEVYIDRLERDLDGSKMIELPAVPDLLDTLAERDDVTLGLLTGNWEEGARVKLSRFELNHFFPFGAFGDGQLERTDLPPVALEKARQYTGREFETDDTVIVGDSILDVAAAQAHGIMSVAVATGWTPAVKLESAGADRVIPSLEHFDDLDLGL